MTYVHAAESFLVGHRVWLDVFTFVLLAAYTFAAYQQVSKSTEAVREAHRAADAALDTLRMAETSSRLDHRAWVGVAAFRLSGTLEEGGMVYVTYSVSNSGRTPAVAVNIAAQIGIGADPGRAPDWGTMKGSTASVLFPNAAAVRGDTPQLLVTPESAEAYISKRFRLYVRVFVSYEDVFGGTHFTQVCLQHTHDTDPGYFSHCPIDNDVDREAR